MMNEETKMVNKSRREFLINSGVLGAGIILYPRAVIFSEQNKYKNKYKKVFNWLMKKPKGSEDILLARDDFFTRQIVKKEDISKHNYDWRWDLHRIAINFIKNKKEEIKFFSEFYVNLREYQELSTARSRQFVEYIFLDKNIDGKLEKFARQFQILQSDKGDEKTYYHLCPQYPDWFVKKDRNRLKIEDAQIKYDKEIDYWLSQSKKCHQQKQEV